MTFKTINCISSKPFITFNDSWQVLELLTKQMIGSLNFDAEQFLKKKVIV